MESTLVRRGRLDVEIGNWEFGVTKCRLHQDGKVDSPYCTLPLGKVRLP